MMCLFGGIPQAPKIDLHHSIDILPVGTSGARYECECHDCGVVAIA
jgi:hypothetical protein